MGFKAELFLKSIDENLFCSICHEVFEDPVSCKDGHTFCKDCITTWIKTNKKCPLDNKSLEEKQLVRLLTVRGIIDNLDVYCHRQDGVANADESHTASTEAGDFQVECDWIGKLQNLSQHRKTCPFLEVKCPHGCNEKIQKRKMKDHEEICEQKLIGCSECGLDILRKDLEKHKANECLQALVSCPNECRNSEELIKKLKRINLADHLSNVCPKGLVDCAYKEQGCEVKVERQYVEKHVQENMAGHMMLLARECSSLRRQNQSLVRKNEQLSKELSHVKAKEISFEKRLKQIKAEIPDTYTWTIHDFKLQVKNRNLHYFRSPTFWLCGCCWYLQIYPNGGRDNRGYLAIYLHAGVPTPDYTMVVLDNDEMSVFFRVTLRSQDPFYPDESRDASCLFGKSERLGWPLFMKIEKAYSSAYYDFEKDSITIQCTIQIDKPQ